MDLTTKTSLEIRDIITQYCLLAEPNRVFLGFKKDIDKELVIETDYPIPNQKVIVSLWDIRKLGYATFKEMSKDDFEKTFNILSYNVTEKNREIITLINKLELFNFKYNDRSKIFTHYN